MRIVVSDYGATPKAGGVFSVLKDFYMDALKQDKTNNWYFILSGKYFPTSKNVKIIVRQDLKRSRIKKLIFELQSGHKFINEFNPDVFISLQNFCTLGLDAPIKIVYLHQSIPFFKGHRFSFIKPNERKVAFYQRLVGKVIKYTLSREKPLTIVQTKWMKKVVINQTKLPAKNIITVSPQVEEMDDKRKFNNKVLNQFFYPATGYVYKNHQLILQAIDILRQKGIKNYQVLFTLTKQQLPNDIPNVHLVGYLPRPKVLQMYEDHVLIFPSYIESFGLPLLEAAQNADIILASDTAFAHEVLGNYHNAYYFNYRDPYRLAKLMHLVMVGKIKSDGHPIHLNYVSEPLLTTVNKIIAQSKPKEHSNEK